MGWVDVYWTISQHALDREAQTQIKYVFNETHSVEKSLIGYTKLRELKERKCYRSECSVRHIFPTKLLLTINT